MFYIETFFRDIFSSILSPCYKANNLIQNVLQSCLNSKIIRFKYERMLKGQFREKKKLNQTQLKIIINKLKDLE